MTFSKFKQESLFPATSRQSSGANFFMRQICVKCPTVQKGGMTLTEYKTMFTLWCIVKSPLILGSDLRTMEENDEAYKVRNRFLSRNLLKSIQNIHESKIKVEFENILTEPIQNMRDIISRVCEESISRFKFRF